MTRIWRWCSLAILVGCTGCGHSGAGDGPGSLAWNRAFTALNQRCIAIATQRFPHETISGAGISGQYAWALVRDLTDQHEVAAPALHPDDATSNEMVTTCTVTSSAPQPNAPTVWPAGCHAISFSPVRLEIYLLASGRTGTITEKPDQPSGLPSGTCIVPYGHLAEN